MLNRSHKWLEARFSYYPTVIMPFCQIQANSLDPAVLEECASRGVDCDIVRQSMAKRKHDGYSTIYKLIDKKLRAARARESEVENNLTLKEISASIHNFRNRPNSPSRVTSPKGSNLSERQSISPKVQGKQLFDSKRRSSPTSTPFESVNKVKPAEEQLKTIPARTSKVSKKLDLDEDLNKPRQSMISDIKDEYNLKVTQPPRESHNLRYFTTQSSKNKISRRNNQKKIVGNESFRSCDHKYIQASLMKTTSRGRHKIHSNKSVDAEESFNISTHRKFLATVIMERINERKKKISNVTSNPGTRKPSPTNSRPRHVVKVPARVGGLLLTSTSRPERLCPERPQIKDLHNTTEFPRSVVMSPKSRSRPTYNLGEKVASSLKSSHSKLNQNPTQIVINTKNPTSINIIFSSSNDHKSMLSSAQHENTPARADRYLSIEDSTARPSVNKDNYPSSLVQTPVGERARMKKSFGQHPFYASTERERSIGYSSHQMPRKEHLYKSQGEDSCPYGVISSQFTANKATGGVSLDMLTPWAPNVFLNRAVQLLNQQGIGSVVVRGGLSLGTGKISLVESLPGIWAIRGYLRNNSVVNNILETLCKESWEQEEIRYQSMLSSEN